MADSKSIDTSGAQAPENMTPEEFEAWRDSLNPDTMGFRGTAEGAGEDGV